MQQTQIGRYKIIDELGAGGMGRVYRAFDPLRNREVALKVINLDALRRFAAEEREKVLKRFYYEVRVIAQLQHVAIVPLFDSGDDNGTPYMVMPLMRGGSLEKRLRDEQGNPQPLPFAEIERILTWITPALDKMHAQKIVHRDLKPDNILFDDDNHPYIADFGIAKMTEGSITFNTGTIGTPAYMSPEQVNEQKQVDARSDIYSLGAILYKMLTGDRPYHQVHPIGLPHYHINEPPPRLDELRSDLSPDWQAIIDKAMAKKPTERYQTASDLSAAVTQLLRNEAEREVRERKAREEAARQAELERLRREAEAAREQAETARQQAFYEKQQREAALRQVESARKQIIHKNKPHKGVVLQAKNERLQREAALREAESARQQAWREKQLREVTLQEAEAALQRAKSTIPLLSPINPLDHLRLLWWTLVTPQQLKRYQGQHGKEAITPTGTWLASTLTWSPLLFPTLALGLETLPHGPEAFSATAYLWMGGGLFIMWVYTGFFGDRYDHDKAINVLLSMTILVIFAVISAVVGEWVLKDSYIILLFISELIAMLLSVIVAKVIAEEMLFFMGCTVVGGAVFMTVFAGLEAALMINTKMETARFMMLSMAAFIAGLIAAGVVLGVGEALVAAIGIEKSIESGEPSWLGRGAFGALVVAYAFLLWFCFFGGWRAFA